MALSFGSRLLKEYRSVVRHSTAGAADSESGDVLLLFPNVGDDSLRNWTAFIRASADTPYADVFLELRIRVPNTYPLQPPSIVFETAVFHPNVHFKVCNVAGHGRRPAHHQLMPFPFAERRDLHRHSEEGVVACMDARVLSACRSRPPCCRRVREPA